MKTAPHGAPFCIAVSTTATAAHRPLSDGAFTTPLTIPCARLRDRAAHPVCLQTQPCHVPSHKRGPRCPSRSTAFVRPTMCRNPRLAISCRHVGHLCTIWGDRPFGWLVNHDQIRVAHQRAAHGQHLLFTTGQNRRLDIGAASRGFQNISNMFCIDQRPAPSFWPGLRPSVRFCAWSDQGKISRFSGTYPMPMLAISKRLLAGDFLTSET